MYENRVARKMFRTKTVEVAGGWENILLLDGRNKG